MKSNGSIDNALELLDRLSYAWQGMTAIEISEYLGVTRGTAYSMLRSLTDRDYVERDRQTGRFMLGYKSLENAISYQYSFPFVEYGIPYMRLAVDELSVCCALSVFRGHKSIHILTVNFEPDFKKISRAYPIWACATGRVLLSALSEKTIDEELSQERIPLTSATITDETKLRELIAQAGEQGYSVDVGEIDPNKANIAAPIYDISNRVLASLSFIIPSKRWEADRDVLTVKIREYASLISVQLGYKGQSHIIQTTQSKTAARTD